VQITVDLTLGSIDQNLVETDDAIRLRRIVNRIKHFAEDITGQPENQADLTLPMWLRRNGVASRTAELTYSEIAENLREMADAASILQNPQEAAQ
jgi:hypothetical protein